MTRGWAVSALSVAACALAAVPATSNDRGVHASRPTQESAPAIEVTGVWQTMTNDIRHPFNVTQCIRDGSSFSERNPEPGTPWTLWLTQVGTTLSGTLQNSGPYNWCTLDPVPIDDGTIEGDVLSFRVVTPSGSTIEFAGVVEADGSTITFTRSPVAPGAAAPAPNNLGPFNTRSESYGKYFTVQRVPSPAGNGCPDGSPATERVSMAHCETADPQAPPFATGTSRWVATEGIGFSPWTFDLTIGLHGVVTGSVVQSAMSQATRSGPVPTGPFAIASGQADARRLSFTLRSPDGVRIVSFSGVRHGTDAIDFRRTVVNLSSLSPSDSRLNDLFGPEAATEFTAWRAPSDPSATSPVALSGVPSDDTVMLESVEDRAAVVPASPPDGFAALPQAAVARPAFVLIRYDVHPTFQGRLFVLALDAAGQPLRQFEVISTPGRHVALWDLRPTGTGPADNNATEQDLRITAETHAPIVADAIRLATDVPSEAAATGLAATLSAMLAGPGWGDATQAGSRFVAPGNDTIALARLDGGSPVVLATRPCVVTPASVK